VSCVLILKYSCINSLNVKLVLNFMSSSLTSSLFTYFKYMFSTFSKVAYPGSLQQGFFKHDWHG
ncbi:uncharacterized protein METZ01_LOCUS142113, partial [marine metagenome]